MGPKLLGGTASLLAAAFVLALPSMFKVEPADEVEPIRFGPPPVAKLAQAVRVIPSEPAFSPPAVAPSSTPLVVTGSGGDEGGRATAGTRAASAQGPGDNVRPEAGEDESQGGTGSGNGGSADEGEGADLDDVGDDDEVGEEEDVGEDDEVNEVDEDDLGEDEDDEEDD